MSKMPVYLSDFKRVEPTYRRTQEELAAWLAKAHTAAHRRTLGFTENDPAFEKRMNMLIRRFGCGPDKIAARKTEVPDIQNDTFQEPGLFGILSDTLTESKDAAGILEKSLFFSKRADLVFGKLYENQKSGPDHIVHVTCTGYVSPSPAQKLVESQGWSSSTEVTHAYHMGCYASVPAIRIAKGMVADGQQRVDIVHTEMCTLHFNPGEHTPEQLVVQSLFSDGFIKYTATPHKAQQGFELIALKEWIIPATADSMTWIPTEHGMRMTLERDVPEKIAHSVVRFVEDLLEKGDAQASTLVPESHFAIHPGGPRIIDSLVTLLGLRPEQVTHSRKILLERGNMSSATLPHIWQSIADDPSVPSGKTIISLAFGPGLSIFGSIMKKL